VDSGRNEVADARLTRRPAAQAALAVGPYRIELARLGPANIVKSASKGDQGRPLPRGARPYGVGGFHSAKRLAQWRALPAYVRDRTEQGDSIRRAKGGSYKPGLHVVTSRQKFILVRLMITPK
jgi:hypothetical protein